VCPTFDRRGSVGRGVLADGSRKLYQNCEPSPWDAMETNRAVHELSEALGDHESDASAFDRARLLTRALERLKHLSCLFERMPMPVSLIGDANRSRCPLRDLDANPSRRTIVLHRVGAEVHQDLGQSRPIGRCHRQGPPGPSPLPDDAVARRDRFQCLRHLSEYVGDADRLERERDPARFDL